MNWLVVESELEGGKEKKEEEGEEVMEEEEKEEKGEEEKEEVKGVGSTDVVFTSSVVTVFTMFPAHTIPPGSSVCTTMQGSS